MKNAWNGLNPYCLNRFGQFFIPKFPFFIFITIVIHTHFLLNKISSSTHLGHDKYKPVMYAPYVILDTFCGWYGQKNHETVGKIKLNYVYFTTFCHRQFFSWGRTKNMLQASLEYWPTLNTCYIKKYLGLLWYFDIFYIRYLLTSFIK